MSDVALTLDGIAPTPRSEETRRRLAEDFAALLSPYDTALWERVSQLIQRAHLLGLLERAEVASADELETYRAMGVTDYPCQNCGLPMEPDQQLKRERPPMRFDWVHVECPKR